MNAPEDLTAILDLYDELYWLPEKTAQEEALDVPEIVQVKQVPCIIYVDETPTDTEELLLRNILKAVQINLEDVGVVVSGGVVSTGFSSKRMLHFSNKNTEDAYRIRNEEGASHLYGHALGSIHSDVQLKRQLWEGMKVLFGV